MFEDIEIRVTDAYSRNYRLHRSSMNFYATHEPRFVENVL